MATMGQAPVGVGWRGTKWGEVSELGAGKAPTSRKERHHFPMGDLDGGTDINRSKKEGSCGGRGGVGACR